MPSSYRGVRPPAARLVKWTPGGDDAVMVHEPEEHLAIRVHMMPKDTNGLGTIFGGVILSLIDQAGFDEARRHGRHRWVTVAFDGVTFTEPVFVGDRVSLFTRTIGKGRRSVDIAVRVEAVRFQTDDVVDVTQARVTMVSVDADGASIESDAPPTLGPGS